MKRTKTKSGRIYSFLMNCTAPVLTTIFISSAVCWAAELQYSESVVYNENPQTVAVLSEIPEKKFSAVPEQHAEPALPVSEIAVIDNVNSGAELVEACGIYIGDEFVGAVSDGEAIEQELSVVLENYREEENIIEADFAVEPDIKQGLYRTEALVDETDMAQFLTGEKKVVSEYTAEEEDTPEKIAEDFGMSVEEVKELNPEIESIENGEQVKVKEKVSVLPVKYTCEEQEEEIVEIDTFSYNDSYELVSDGVKGRKLTTYEVTYIDGNEVSRKVTSTETVELPSEQPQQIDPSVDYTDYDSSQQDEQSPIENTNDTEHLQTQEESVSETENIFSGSFIWPVNGGYVSDPFMSDRNHKGLDIAAPSGTDIYASDSGIVTEAGWNDGGYGYCVVIDHGNGYVTLYAHASEVFVSVGQIVSQGDLIAAVGTTGDSTGNHCHFEVRYDGSYLNPQDFV
ncbi:MAG: peptidoglycan DD-metalloendopeptidase family protein [Oscillospiraceae bacterium]|nr:peptidoglycan DD-metalloendopeptidase family protein [Oscillospiraceae bacterium]